MTDKNGMLIFILLIAVIIVYMWWMQNKEDFGSQYAKLGGGYNTQLFSPCVSKRCAGGPYMFTSDPYMQALCQGVTNADLAQKACGKAFTGGQPVRFDYSSLSNGAWDNALCNSSSPSSLCVL
jgi:hypothetical protein